MGKSWLSYSALYFVILLFKVAEGGKKEQDLSQLGSRWGKYLVRAEISLVFRDWQGPSLPALVPGSAAIVSCGCSTGWRGCHTDTNALQVSRSSGHIWGWTYFFALCFFFFFFPQE